MKKKTLHFMIVAVLICISGTALVNCNTDDYLDDGGISSAHYDGTVMDFLQSRPDIFSSLIEIIDYCGMHDVFTNDTITFFAPTEWSINNTMKRLNYMYYNRMGKDSINDIRQIKPEVWREFLSLYVIKDKYLLKDIPQIDTMAIDAYPGQAYETYNSRPMNAGVFYMDANNVKYAGYRFLSLRF